MFSLLLLKRISMLITKDFLLSVMVLMMFSAKVSIVLLFVWIVSLFVRLTGLMNLRNCRMKHYNDVISPKDRARLVRSIASLDKRLAALWQKQCKRSEANRIAEEKRNFELTKKYNLLDFV